jgi:UDP-glucuronate decarboxylase
LPQDDPKQRKPGITLVKEKLHWAPKVSLDDRLKETATFFKN